MDSIYLILFISLSLFGALYQLLKINRNGSAIGISRNAYIVGVVTGSMIYLQAENQNMMIVGIIDIIFSIFFITIVTYFNYRNGVSSTERENYKTLWISLIGAFFMIFGVAQSIKSYLSKDKTTNVSVITYFIFSLLSILTILLADSQLIIISSIISIVLYMFIIYSSVEFKK